MTSESWIEVRGEQRYSNYSRLKDKVRFEQVKDE